MRNKIARSFPREFTLKACFIVGSVITYFVLDCSVVGAQQNDSIENRDIVAKILNVWRKRQSSVQSFDYSWKQLEFRDSDPFQTDASDPYTVDRVTRFVMSGEKIRIDESPHSESATDRKLRGDEARIAFVWDGQIGKQLRYPIGPDDSPYCEITERSRTIKLVEVEFAPLQLHFRPFGHPLLNFDPSNIALEKNRENVDGHECLVLTIGFRGDEVYRLFVENHGEVYPIRRMIRGQKGRVFLQRVDISYTADSQLGLVPIVWRTAYEGSDFYRKITVFEHSLSPTVVQDIFDLELPTGTRVKDWSAGGTALREYVIGESSSRPDVPRVGNQEQ